MLSGCVGSDYIPKPRGYFRIEFPEKKYILFDSTCPYTFEYPEYATVKPDLDPNSENYWINILYTRFDGVLYISYKHIDNNLFEYFEDSRDFASKHIPKADDIENIPVSYDSSKVWGLIYDIRGTGVASPYQFSVTDSVNHFMRGALYFNVVPNNDSLMPVLDFIKEDVEHMIKTLKWK